jgi:hypothetical protein
VVSEIADALRRARWDPHDDPATVIATLHRLAAELDALPAVPAEVAAFRAALDRPDPSPHLHAEQARLLARHERDARPGLAPEHLRPRPDHSEVMTVDGHDFRVSTRAGEPGTYDFDWLTGPHEYGFGISRSGGAPMTRPEAERAIRDFLGQIDPETGYLD